MTRPLGRRSSVIPSLLLAVLLKSSSAQTPSLSQPSSPSPAQQQKTTAAQPPQETAPAGTIGDAERSAIHFTAYDLSLQIVPAQSKISALARITVQNDSAEPLARIPLQITSSLKWESFSMRSEGRAFKLNFDQHPLQTDADHTGEASEAVVTLPSPLGPHQSAELTAIYSGTVTRSTRRLERMGAPSSEASGADWDNIAEDGTLLRGFGDVLWYPVASPQVFLGDGAGYLRAVGRQKLQQAAASVRLRLTLEYTGEGPSLAFFCGREQPLKPLTDNPNAPTAEAPGLSTAEFDSRDLGFRTMSLFITGKSTLAVGALARIIPADSPLATQLSPAAKAPVALIADWFGADPLQELTIIDHQGQPFEDGALLVGRPQASDPDQLSAALVHSLTHAWFRSSHPWLDEGMAQWMSWLWIEHTRGRAAAIDELQRQSHALALAESTATQGPGGTGGQSLIEASDPVYYRAKAAAVLWSLREIVGDDALKSALRQYRRDTRIDRDPHGFQSVLEQVSNRKLGWIFDDWVYHDRGLPDLSIVNVAPRQLAAGGNGGWLVAVEVRNDGSAIAEVPVTVRSGTLTATERLRIPPGSAASTRIPFQSLPEQVQVNDGSVPEMISSIHTRKIEAH